MEVIGSGEECLERDAPVAEILHPDLVEIIPPAHDGEIIRPVILDTPIDDIAAGFGFLDRVGAGGHRRFQGGRRKRDLFVIAGGEDRQLGQLQRQPAIGRYPEMKSDGSFRQRLGLRHIGQKHAELRMPVLYQRVEGEDHIGGCHR